MGRGASKAAGLGLLCTLVLLAFFARVADAKATYESPYGYERTWNAAIRLVRVDNGWKVTEKDEGNGYLMFEYTSPENSKPVAASLELVRNGDGDGVVDVVLQIPKMPRYHEQTVLDALSSKMRREYGDPPARPRHARPDDPEDAGSTAADSD